MLLTRIPRAHLITSLNLASEKRFYTLYQYISDPQRLRKLVPEAIEKARVYVPSKFESQVVQALSELEKLAERLERELAEPSPTFIELAKSVVESVASGNDDIVKKFIAERFEDFARLFPLDGVPAKREIDKVLVFSPRKSDISKLLYLFTDDDPDRAIYNLVSRAFSAGTFKEALYELVGRVVGIDASTMEVSVANHRMRLSPTELTRVLIALGRSGELEEHLRRLYSKQLEELSKQLGVGVELAGVNIVNQSNVEAKVEFLVRSAEKVAGISTSSEYQVLVSVRLVNAKPHVVEEYYKYGDSLVLFDWFEYRDEGMFAQVRDDLRSSSFRNGLEALDYAIRSVTLLGYKVEHLYREYSGNVFIRATKGESILEYSYNLDTRCGNARIYVPVPSYSSRVRYTVGNVDISVSRKYMCASMSNATPHDLARLEEIATEELLKLAKTWREKYAGIPDTDAAVIYAIYKYEGISKNGLANSVGISLPLLFLKAGRAFRGVSRLPPRLLVELPKHMYENGVLAIDDDGYIRVFGKRLVDVSKQYFKNATHGELAEKRILDSILSHYANMELFEGRRVPGRVIRLLVEEASNPRAIKRAAEHLANIAGNKRLWESLSQHEKMLIIVSCGSTLIEKAKNGNWWWILNDKVVEMLASASKLRSPSEITKFLAENFPEALGSDYELVNINGEYFIKHRRAYLQVKKVFFDGFLFQGTIVGGNVGMFLKARTVNEASEIVQSSIMDHVLDFKELVSELRAKGYSVVVGKHETPLFSVPYITVAAGTRRVTVPLQANFREKVEKILEKVQAESQELQEELA